MLKSINRGPFSYGKTCPLVNPCGILVADNGPLCWGQGPISLGNNFFLYAALTGLLPQAQGAWGPFISLIIASLIGPIGPIFRAIITSSIGPHGPIPQGSRAQFYCNYYYIYWAIGPNYLGHRDGIIAPTIGLKGPFIKASWAFS